jgi:hypothetical protein
MKKPRKPKKRRDEAKHPNLKHEYNPRVRHEYMDWDYLDTLPPDAKDFLNQFAGEYYGAAFKKDGTDIQSYEKYGKDANDRNNARNRCLYSSLKNRGDRNNKNLLDYDWIASSENKLSLDDKFNAGADPRHIENAYIDFLEMKEIEAMMQEYDLAMLAFSETIELLL